MLAMVSREVAKRRAQYNMLSDSRGNCYKRGSMTKQNLSGPRARASLSGPKPILMQTTGPHVPPCPGTLGELGALGPNAPAFLPPVADGTWTDAAAIPVPNTKACA